MRCSVWKFSPASLTGGATPRQGKPAMNTSGTPSETQSPFNALPPMVIVLAVVILGIEALFGLGARGLIGGPEAVGWRISAIQSHGFSNLAVTWMLENRILRGDYLLRFLTYPFVHGAFTHALFAAVMVLALGKFVGERLNQWAVVTLFFAASVIGALVYALVLPDGPGLFGAFPGIFGLIGGFTCLLWLHLGQIGAQQMRAFTLIGVLLGLQLVFGLLFGAGPMWIADVAAFVAGFFLTIILVPGGLQNLRQRLQRR
jgi:membrane associated rhomboid family serine protease